jgi:small multidrug resistance family-3 protein
MKDILLLIIAAFFEIFGCYAFWIFFKSSRSIYWLVPGMLSLMVFAYLLTKVQAEFAGRAYAVYGGIYIATSLLWLYLAEHQVPNKWDMIGALLCITGALIILLMPG